MKGEFFVKKKKKLLNVLLIIFIVLGLGSGIGAEELQKQITAYKDVAISIKVNGNALSSADIIVHENRTYVPVRTLAEALGAEVNWDDKTGTVNINANETKENEKTVVKNVIYMIGDGMGLAQTQHAQWYYVGAYDRLSMQTMPVIGLASTYSANSGVTDSAAAGTALATGYKANNGALGIDPNGKKLKNIMEAARELGKSTGIVVTSSVTDATPAAFYAHVKSRQSHEEIAASIVDSNLDVILGGGKKYFLPESESGSRTDNRNLITEMQRKQYTFVSNISQMNNVKSGKIMGLFKAGDLETPYPKDNSGVEPTIEEMTRKAIELLSSNPNGFVLMVEGSKIDKVAHANNQDVMMREVMLFDNAVKAALEFAEKDGNTLVVVTADHETGGLTLASATRTKGTKQPAQWTTKDHTAVHVPIYAYGPGAIEFTGLMENNEIPRKLATLLQLKDFPKIMD